LDKPPVILVHGAWHDSRCWAQVAAWLVDKGIEVHVPDLPGHGSNQSIPLHRVTLSAYVTCLASLLASLDRPAMLVAHSMAGVPVTQLAAQHPEQIRGIVHVSAYLPGPNESLFDLMALNRQGEAATPIEQALQMSADKRTCNVATESIVPLFYNRCAPAQATEAAALFGVQPTLPLSAKVRYDVKSLAGIEEVYLCCTDDRVLPLAHQHRMLGRRNCSTLLQIDSDHSPFWSCPDQLSALLLAAHDKFSR
jgi:pimeloyl-ACP methyl ester carboxylesterase